MILEQTDDLLRCCCKQGFGGCTQGTPTCAARDSDMVRGTSSQHPKYAALAHAVLAFNHEF